MICASVLLRPLTRLLSHSLRNLLAGLRVSQTALALKEMAILERALEHNASSEALLFFLAASVLPRVRFWLLLSHLLRLCVLTRVRNLSAHGASPQFFLLACVLSARYDEPGMSAVQPNYVKRSRA
jgi:hypothetical protein